MRGSLYIGSYSKHVIYFTENFNLASVQSFPITCRPYTHTEKLVAPKSAECYHPAILFAVLILRAHDDNDDFQAKLSRRNSFLWEGRQKLEFTKNTDLHSCKYHRCAVPMTVQPRNILLCSILLNLRCIILL